MKITQLLDNTYAYDKNTHARFSALANSSKNLRDHGVQKHICAYTVPVSIRRNQVFLVHHKKADLWISPGGHIDSGETAQETLSREVKEELNLTTKNHMDIFPFYISILSLKNSQVPKCLQHYSFWFALDADSINPDMGEIYDSEWFDLDKKIHRLKSEENIQAIKILSENIHDQQFRNNYIAKTLQM